MAFIKHSDGKIISVVDINKVVPEKEEADIKKEKKEVKTSSSDKSGS